MANLLINMDDREFADKARQFFLAEYRERRAAQIARIEAQSENPQEEAPNEQGTCFHLGEDNLPDEHLPVEHFRYLMNARNQILEINDSILPETDDADAAALILTRRALLHFALQLLKSLITFILFDKRFHADNPVQVDALSALDPKNIWGQTDTQLQTMNAFVCLCDQLNASTPDNSPLASEMRVLNLVGDIYFNTLQSVFPIGAVNKCHTAFTLLMQDLGVKYSSDAVGNYLRRRRTMYNEIVNWSRSGGTVTTNELMHAIRARDNAIDALQDQVKDLNTSVTTNTKTIANFDRRQKTFLEHLKKTFAAFIKLFRPAAKPPTREQVSAGLSLKDRYACLDKVDEPHRSQLKAVIDYTYKHPIVRDAKRRSDISLADAARAVWNENNLKWVLVPDAYATFEQLKSACYNIQEKHSDAFCYQK